jgi:thermostable 8-oxoguanine DNA glycosylase
MTIDPKNITNFNRNKLELQAFWIFCILVAGKNSDIASRKLSQLMSRANGDLFQYFKDLGVGLHNFLVANKVGQYNRITKAIRHSLDLDLVNDSLERLLKVYGVGNKTARFFLLHTRENQNIAVLDVHILNWLRKVSGDDSAIEIPLSTPQDEKKYKQIESLFFYYKTIYFPNVSTAQADLLIWTEMSGRNN